jgi:arylformamidase
MSIASDANFLDREYNPRTQVPEFASYLARWQDSAREARASGKVHLDLRYGLLPAETLDFFPAAGTSRPLLIFLHGGYWRALDKSDFSWVAPPYVAADISVAVVNYGLMPLTPLLQIVEQVRRACAWLHQNAQALNVNSERIVCSGHSAGGHLTAMMFGTNWPGVWPDLPKRLLSGAVAVSGLFDLEPLTRAAFLRDDLRLDPVLTQALSPAFLPWRNDAPLVRAVGSEESTEFHRQSRLLASAWPQACQQDLIDVPACNHFSVCDALADRGSVLFRAVTGLLLG